MINYLILSRNHTIANIPFEKGKTCYMYTFCIKIINPLSAYCLQRAAKKLRSRSMPIGMPQDIRIQEKSLIEHQAWNFIHFYKRIFKNFLHQPQRPPCGSAILASPLTPSEYSLFLKLRPRIFRSSDGPIVQFSSSFPRYLKLQLPFYFSCRGLLENADSFIDASYSYKHWEL